MNDDSMWCHHCDCPVRDWEVFAWHADQGHAVTAGRCPGDCQFEGAR